MAEDKEMYALICKQRFDSLDAKTAEILGLLRGRNGEPGLLDDMRAVKANHRRAFGCLVFFAGAVTIQLINSLWQWLFTGR